MQNNNNNTKNRVLPLTFVTGLLLAMMMTGTAQADLTRYAQDATGQIAPAPCPPPCDEETINSVGVGGGTKPVDDLLAFIFELKGFSGITGESLAPEDKGTQRVTVRLEATAGSAFVVSKANGPEPEYLGDNLWLVHFPAKKNHGDFLVRLTDFGSMDSATIALQVMPDSQASAAEPSYVPAPTKGTDAVTFAR